MQKTLSHLGEDELARDDFEQAFIYEKVAQFIKPERPMAKTSQIIDGEDEGT